MNDPLLTAHDGVLRVETDPEHAIVEVEFDPGVLSDGQVRSMLKEHIVHVESSIRKNTFRLHGNACEACAQKLEKKVARIPGVRRATATYLGRVLTVTFDSDIEPESRMEMDLRNSGANVKPLEKNSSAKLPLLAKLRKGELNEELSCGLGLISLITAVVIEKTMGVGPWSYAFYTSAYIFAGQEGVRSAIASLKEMVLDVDVLMVLAAIGAALIGAPFEGALLLFLFSFSN
nr:cation transporter [Akkermansiaceae bacterium]